MLLPVALKSPSLCQPELGFHEFHHCVGPKQVAGPKQVKPVSRTAAIGVCASLTAAQSDARNAQKNIPKGKTQVHLGVGEYEQVHLTMEEGARTVRAVAQTTQPINAHGNETWDPIMGGEAERALLETDASEAGANARRTVKPPPKTSMPEHPPFPQSKIRNDTRETVAATHVDPNWAQSRVPYFRKRDEGPFRRPEDPPYQTTMSCTRRLPRSCGRSILQIVEPQPDELNESEIEDAEAKAHTAPEMGRGREVAKGESVNGNVTRKPRWQKATRKQGVKEGTSTQLLGTVTKQGYQQWLADAKRKAMQAIDGGASVVSNRGQDENLAANIAQRAS